MLLRRSSVRSFSFHASALVTGRGMLGYETVGLMVGLGVGLSLDKLLVTTVLSSSSSWRIEKGLFGVGVGVYCVLRTLLFLVHKFAAPNFHIFCQPPWLCCCHCPPCCCHCPLLLLQRPRRPPRRDTCCCCCWGYCCCCWRQSRWLFIVHCAFVTLWASNHPSPAPVP